MAKAKAKKIARKIGDRFPTFIGLESGRCALFINELVHEPENANDPRPEAERLWNRIVGELILPDEATAREVMKWIR